MNEHYVIELFQRVLDQAIWCGSDELRKQGWCITSETLENELFDYIREHELSEVQAIEELLTERFESLLQVELERETRLLIPPYSDMLIESIKSFNLGFYNICIPSLFSIIESALMHLANKGEYNNIRYVSGIRKRESSEVLHLGLKSKLFQIANTTEELFSPMRFDASECDITLNRHVSAHGRRESSYNKTDCLKLFLLLASIKSCYSN
ncbi:hypothetical protein [Vibrio sp. 10N.222.55.A1]|uniref:hypothetical protein n=1 Tax=Vibrio sp. 10N.222.55.A1 TaxID=3229646 RepID=UPI00355415A7